MVDDNIENFKKHILERLSLSERLCVDEIFIRWYGLGSKCIKLDLPHYVQMDCKSYSGWKIQVTCYWRIIVMPKLNLVKCETADEAYATTNRTSPAWGVNH